MENNAVPARAGTTRRVFLSASAVAAATVPLISGSAQAATGAKLRRSATDPALRDLLRQIDPNRIQATITKLVSFGTRHTASSQTDPNRGIGAATQWVTDQMNSFAANSNGRMTVQQQTFVQPVSSNIPVPTTITNVIATIQGTATPQRFYVITGHLDSRVSDVLNFTDDAPGADDDGSGVAVVLELARVFATHQFPGTLVLATVAGEEQGLYGSAHMATQMAAAGNDVQGMFSNDIVGASQAFDGTKPDPRTVRLFVEGIPTAVTPNQISLMQSVGGENDGMTHQLARFVQDNAPFSLTGMNIRVIWRRDRYLRGSDHISFQQHGYPAARLTEPRENFAHEHQDVRVDNGTQFGDLEKFVDFDYTARVARVNAAALWALATNPATPKKVEIHTAPPAGFPGTNLTSLDWAANPEPDISG
jgi:Zn-dependent M28 family amino/carboxypeptidase